VPHTSIGTQAAWSKSGYHGWWYGWKLHLAVVVGSLWIPLAAEFTIASEAANVIAPKLLEQLPLAVRYVRGDTHDNTPELRQECALHNPLLPTSPRESRFSLAYSHPYARNVMTWRQSCTSKPRCTRSTNSTN
jgi:hypothetical protein